MGQLLFLHGYGRPPSDYAGLVDGLRAAGHDVKAPFFYGNHALGAPPRTVDEGLALTLEYVERLYPGDLQSTRRLGWLLYEAERFEGAAQRFERVLSESPQRYETAFFLGLARKRAGFAEGALAASA